MGLSRMAMALTVARCLGRRLTISSAGMPPALHFRAATGEIDEIALPGMPLGARADFDYAEREIELAPGDSLLLMSDGFPELANPGGEEGDYRFLTSGDPEALRASGTRFLQLPIGQVEHVTLAGEFAATNGGTP